MQKSRIIWIIDENSLSGMDLSSHFKSLGHIPTHIYTAKEAFARAKHDLPDLVLLNPELGDIDAIDLMIKLKKRFDYKEIPFIFISDQQTPESIAQTLTSGAFDYVRKPFSYIELDARIQSALSKKDIYNDLQEKNERLKKMSVTDSLTGLYNHRYLIKQLESSFNLFKRFNRPFSFIMLDIDHFKKVNDSYGHITGDQVLVELSNTLGSQRRNTDIIGRYGGEEFGLLLPEITSEKVKEVAKKVLNDIRNLNFNPRHKPSINFGISTSIGVTSCPDIKVSNSEDVIHQADQGLYKAKEMGGNTIVQSKNGLLTEIKVTF